jgi:hypothetical protein
MYLVWDASGPESGPHRELRVELSRCSRLLQAAQGCSGSEQPYTATAQGCLFIAQVAVTCAQVSKRKWNLERSSLVCE